MMFRAARRRSLCLLAAAATAFLISRGGAAETVAANPSESATDPGSQSEGDGLLSSLSFTAERGPVTIEANRLEFDYRTRTLTYRGAVKVAQGDLTLQSDVLRVVLDEHATERVRHVVAEGRVRIAQGKRVATGGRAVFDQATRTVVLDEAAVVREGLNEVAGDKVTVYLDERRSVVEGGVQAKLFPSGKTAAGVPTAGEGENTDGR